MTEAVSIRSAATATSADPLRVYAHELAGFGGHSPPQETFHRSQERKRLLRWPNQSGKTRAGAAEAWWHALGEHPYRDVPKAPSLGSVLCADLKNGWSKLCVKMREVEPPGALHHDCTYDDVRGYLFRGKRAIGLANGSIIQAFGSEQPLTALASDTVDWQWIDEPPKRAHWGEFRRAAAAKMAPVWVTLTPIGRPVAWLRNIVDGDAARGTPALEPDWDQQVGTLDRTHCPHRSAESIQQQIDECDPQDRNQRIKAGWVGVSLARWIPGFANLLGVDVFDDDEVLPPEADVCALGADYGERPGATVWMLILVDEVSSRVWVLGEWVSQGRLTEVEEAQAVHDELLKAWSVTWHNISMMRGDSNSSGRRGVATSINDLMTRAIARSAKLPRCPFNIETPYKGPGSVRARARMVNTAILEGRLKVHEGCTNLRETLSHWCGQSNSELKHAFDAFGYIAEDWLAPEGAFKTSRFFIK